MNQSAPFNAADLCDLNCLLSQADAVVPMNLISGGLEYERVIGLRHDVDNTISEAVEFARWEAERGYRATYYILPSAPYWHTKEVLQDAIEEIVDCGHEIGYHNNALAQALTENTDPFQIMRETLEELRTLASDVAVVGTVAHGDPLCHSVGFVNDELFTESARPAYGQPDRQVGRIQLRPVSRRVFGFEYDANWILRGDYLSDSGGRWSQPFEQVAEAWPAKGQLHMLVHPCWWREAFLGVAA